MPIPPSEKALPARNNPRSRPRHPQESRMHKMHPARFFQFQVQFKIQPQFKRLHPPSQTHLRSPHAKLSRMKQTPQPVSNSTARAAIALDCEMVGVLETTPGSYTREQSEVVRVVAIDFLTGEVLLDTYVSPLGRVISWRTKYSGVNAFILAQKKREKRVLSGGWTAAREALYRFIDADTVLIGHGLNNDLAVLGMVHSRVVDSAVLTRVAVGEDCQRHWKLRTLVGEFLGLAIQAGDGKDGHDCVEDTFAAREVVLWCLLNEDRLQNWAANERGIIDGKKGKKVSVAHGEDNEVPT
ncbi:uncharacterized protein BDV14DRAFT_167144 [Aspergillus stella-maris]|uniref:uncharacterized protein n=1 Tax=Aspergillus stella-maris TaxID=1810926 RepID=UPI003CCDA6B4